MRHDQPTSLIRHLQVLRAVNEAVSRSLDLNEVLQRSLAALTHVTGHEISSLHLISADGNSLLLRGDRGLSDELRRVNVELPMGEGLIGRVALTGQARRVDDVGVTDDLLPAARVAVNTDGIRGFVCVPIRARHRILGTLSLGRQTEDLFADEEVALLECVADQIGLALDNARLYGEINRQLDDLRRAQIEVVKAERLSAVNGLAAGVAHEINNPLTIIMAQLHLMGQAPMSTQVEEALGVIDAAAKRAASIVRDLILFAEHRPPRRSRCQVTEQIREVVAFEDARLESEGVSVRTNLEPVPDIWADHHHLQEVLLHVIQNAQHAMVEAHGGGVLTIKTTMVESGVRIEVADDGPGIPPEHLPRIFNPFFTTKQPGDGRGLGLSVAHSIVTEHGGRMWAENRPDGGALFTIDLPIGEPEPAREVLRSESRRV
jgi:C4-dicarboxylate-specific signal transduction histidine kinase